MIWSKVYNQKWKLNLTTYLSPDDGLSPKAVLKLDPLDCDVDKTVCIKDSDDVVFLGSVGDVTVLVLSCLWSPPHSVVPRVRLINGEAGFSLEIVSSFFEDPEIH